MNDEVLPFFVDIVSTCMFLNREEIRHFLSPLSVIRRKAKLQKSKAYVVVILKIKINES